MPLAAGLSQAGSAIQGGLWHESACGRADRPGQCQGTVARPRGAVPKCPEPAADLSRGLDSRPPRQRAVCQFIRPDQTLANLLERLDRLLAVEQVAVAGAPKRGLHVGQLHGLRTIVAERQQASDRKSTRLNSSH